MNIFIDKLSSESRHKYRISHIDIQGQILLLSCSSPFTNRRHPEEDSLVDSLLNSRSAYLFHYRRRQREAEAPGGSQPHATSQEESTV